EKEKEAGARREQRRGRSRATRTARSRRAGRDHSGVGAPGRRADRRGHGTAIGFGEWNVIRRGENERMDERALAFGAGAIAVAECGGNGPDQANSVAASAMTIVIPSVARDLLAGARRSLLGVARAVRALPFLAARGAGASAQRLRLHIRRSASSTSEKQIPRRFAPRDDKRKSLPQRGLQPQAWVAIGHSAG